MKVSVFGSGSIGLRHLTNLVKLRKELKISSIFSYDTKNKKKFLGESKKFTFTQNLRVAAENCDVAFICVPTHLHNQTINKILKYTKCHFYIEKPFGTIFMEYGSPIFFEKNMDFDQCKQDFIKGMNNIEHSNLEYANKQNI